MHAMALASFAAALMTGPLSGPLPVSPPAPVTPVPTPQQLAWHDLGMYAFVHFNMNTFTGKEWGEGIEPPSKFAPSELDTRQWTEAFKAAGMRGVIITAKHHDGFCLWPSKFTEHSVKNSPWRDGTGDLLRELSDACNHDGLLFGIYLSPWDRNHPDYGNSDVYNEYFKQQLREVCTQYGPLFEVWFDGACGEGPTGKRQVYDWPAFHAVVRETQLWQRNELGTVSPGRVLPRHSRQGSGTRHRPSRRHALGAGGMRRVHSARVVLASERKRPRQIVERAR